MGRIMKINEHDMLKEMTLDEIRLLAYKIYKKKEVNNPIVEVAKVIRTLTSYTYFSCPYFSFEHIIEDIKNFQPKKKRKKKK